MAGDGEAPIVVENPEGAGAFVVLCDHASSHLPRFYGSLGLTADDLTSHIAWDPGALGVARRMAAKLDAPLIWPNMSRLVIDCNRDPAAHDLITTETEGRAVPGNEALATNERERRLATVHAPYHAAIDACLSRRAATGRSSALLAVHSFTPLWHGESRPWQVGIVFGDDRRLADSVIAGLGNEPGLTIGINQPYAPADRVYYTLARHRRRANLPAVMFEIRNDEIADQDGQQRWADRLSALLESLEPARPAGHAVA
ncbi:MAG: N-formylglutamate amidohydrolase [Hyphomicrobiales bacterium]|nr:N-formylglutamate amidohydrolase [Hyphomicrobiales bacterium]